MRWQRHLAARRQQLITTEYVLVELADGLAGLQFREQAAAVIVALQSDPDVEIVPASSVLLSRALAMYVRRADKQWGLTDCASFVVMEECGLISALTTDDHFRQAGFRALLLEDPADFGT